MRYSVTFKSAIINDFLSGMARRDVAAKHHVTDNYVRGLLYKQGVRKGTTWKFSAEQKSAIVTEYQDGATATTLAAKYDVNRSAVISMIARRGVAIRDEAHIFTPEQELALVREYREGKSTPQIAKTYSVTARYVGLLLKKHGEQSRSLSDSHRIYDFDETVFDTITPDSAYWAGFLMADGAVVGNRLRLILAVKDREHVVKFQDFLKSEHPISQRRTKSYRTMVCDFSIRSAHLVSSLSRFGIVQNKTFSAKTSGLEMNRHFWRGVVDGDGCIGFQECRGHVYPRFQVVGSQSLMLQFACFMRAYCQEWKGNVRPQQNIYAVSTTGRHAKSIIEVLYHKAPTALTRKLAIATAL